MQITTILLEIGLCLCYNTFIEELFLQLENFFWLITYSRSIIARLLFTEEFVYCSQTNWFVVLRQAY